LWAQQALIANLERLQAEEDLRQAEISALFTRTPFDKDGQKQLQRQREKWTAQRARFLAQDVGAPTAPPTIIDPAELGEEERADLVEWARSIGAELV
jgi:hypothetical protein